MPLPLPLLKGASFNDLEQPQTQFDNEYLINGYRYVHSYYRRRIGNRSQAFEWYQFE